MINPQKGIFGNFFPIHNDSSNFYKKLRLCLVPGKYKGNNKNDKENYFLKFGFTMKM